MGGEHEIHVHHTHAHTTKHAEIQKQIHSHTQRRTYRGAEWIARTVMIVAWKASADAAAINCAELRRASLYV
jgi:hypothetical protein